MHAFEVTQALMTVATVYHVRKPGEESVVHTVRGVLMSATPRFHLVEGEQGEALGLLTGNFIKTRYEIADASSALASVVFPAVAFKKTMTLTFAGEVYEADGGVFRGIFECRRASGELMLAITKELSVRDTFRVEVAEAWPLPVAILTAIAIHSRFYEMV